MALQKREKILAGAVGTLVTVLLGHTLLFSGPGGSLADLQQRRDKLTEEKQQKQGRVDQALRKVAGKLNEWNHRSLPPDAKLARPLYEKWLVSLMEEAGLGQAKLEPGKIRARPGVYTAVPLSLRARGSLDKLTAFLYKFYSAGYLHKVRTLSIKPMEKGADFELALAIEALCLPGAEQKDELPSGLRSRLELPDAAAYLALLQRRRMENDRFAAAGGFFAPYAPPPPPPEPPRVVRVEPKADPRPPEPPKPSFDPAKHAFVTAILDVGGKPQVWIVVRTTGQTLKLQQGEPFEIGSVQGTIARINPRSLEIDVGGRRRSVALGANLLEGSTGAGNGSY
jgi:Tfp pilus assembly protein PilO